jgi:hypothetical protein
MRFVIDYRQDYLKCCNRNCAYNSSGLCEYIECINNSVKSCNAWIPISRHKVVNAILELNIVDS